MDSNPVMQRVMMLSEMWSSEVAKRPAARVFCWIGANMVEYKTIKGFVIYQTSLEKTLEDKLLLLAQPFQPQVKNYGESILADLNTYITNWNNDESLRTAMGKIDWQPSEKNVTVTDAAYFIANIKNLATALNITGKPEVLALALFPQVADDRAAYSSWLAAIIKAGIPATVRVMLYDAYDNPAFEALSKQYPSAFKYLQPDLDMPGAMDGILEAAKAKKSSPEEKDMLSFQQGLIKMNEAIAYGDKDNVLFYKDHCIALADKYYWPQQKALAYFFLHTYYASVKDEEAACAAIDKAILTVDEGLAKKVITTNETQYQYRIAKGNLFFMNGQFGKAAEVYKECLNLNRAAANPLMLAGIYQMLGNSLRKHQGATEARPYFKQGWALLTRQGTEALKDNAMAMFYAKDMMAVADEEITRKYAPEMIRFWGADWRQKLSKGYVQTAAS
jgi:tetratricopeptide (TPR) repeat protein